MHYFSPDRALITGLSLPFSPVYFPIKMIVTASGNSSHLNHSSFVETAACDECITEDLRRLEEGLSSSGISQTEVTGPWPQISDAKEIGYQVHVRVRVRGLTLKGSQTQVLNCFKPCVPI